MIYKYYKLLGLKPNCTIEEVKKAYKECAKKYHPDLNESSSKEYYQEKMKQINYAYDQIINYIKTGHYDDNNININSYDPSTNPNLNNQKKTSSKYGRVYNPFNRKNTWGRNGVNLDRVLDLNCLDSSKIYVGDIVKAIVDYRGNVSYKKIFSNYILYDLGFCEYFNISLYLKLNTKKNLKIKLYLDDLPKRYIIENDYRKPYDGYIIANCVEKLDLNQDYINIESFKKDLNIFGGIKKKLIYKKR